MMGKKRILVLAPRFPYPVVGGDRLRIYHLCKALSQNFRLTLLSFCDTKAEVNYAPKDGLFEEIHRIYLPKWRSHWNTGIALLSRTPLQLAYYQSAKFQSKVDELLSTHDLALAHLIRTGQYLEFSLGKPRIVEMTDSISLNYKRMRTENTAFSLKKLLYRIEYAKLRDYELKTIRKFPRTWLVSDVDRIALDPDHTSSIEVIANGVDPENFPFRPPVHGGDTIVFIGNMLSAQNQDACFYFIRSILPIIRKHEYLKFRIVGNIANKARRKFLKYPGVQITGTLPHIADGIDRDAFCGVCPMRAGAGIQNKILEYFALGLPCVTSSIGAEGIDAESGRDILIYQDAEDAARQILTLHANPELRTSLAVSARSLVEKKLAWRFLYQKINDSVQDMLRLTHKDVSK